MTSMGCERLFILWPRGGVTERQGPDSGWKLPLNSHLEPLEDWAERSFSRQLRARSARTAQDWSLSKEQEFPKKTGRNTVEMPHLIFPDHVHMDRPM